MLSDEIFVQSSYKTQWTFQLLYCPFSRPMMFSSRYYSNLIQQRVEKERLFALNWTQGFLQPFSSLADICWSNRATSIESFLWWFLRLCHSINERMLKYPVVNLPEVAISSLNHVIRVGGVGFHLYNVSCVALIISLSSKNTHLPLPAYFLFDATFPLFALIRGLT